MKAFLVMGCLLASATLNAAPVSNAYSIFMEARELDRDGRTREAFFRYLAAPGGEYAAAALARGEANKFISLLEETPDTLESPLARLVEADLLLVVGQREKALQQYHALAAAAQTNDWGTGEAGYYPVEPPRAFGDDGEADDFSRAQPALPFAYGPGSHRDNWLLRRLIALDLTEDAAKEFARLWETHRANAQPYTVVAAHRDVPGQPDGERREMVFPDGFKSLGLQFALDYAFFLKRSGQTNQALAVLLEPLMAMNMDRNPNLLRHEPLIEGSSELPSRNWLIARNRFGFGAGTMGVARKEFIRLAYGEFKSIGREAALVAAIEKQVADGDNRARRVLAQVRLHQGQPETAIALELDYLQHGDFDPLTLAYRRGLIYDEYQQTSDAVAAFEQALAEPPGPLRLADPDERISKRPSWQAQAFFAGQGGHSDTVPVSRLEIQDRLARLYAALGHTDKVLDLLLAQADASDARIENFDSIEQLAQRFKAAGQEARFDDWAKKKIAATTNMSARANLAWQLRDYAAAMTNAAAATSHAGYDGRRGWKERFAKLDRDQERAFLRAVVEANPHDAIARLELLDLKDRLEGPDDIAVLESLLASDAAGAFPRGKGAWNRSQFRGYLDLAYRLMRLYEMQRQLDPLRALGLRLAKSEKPFERDDDEFNLRGGTQPPQTYGNAGLALAVQYADSKAYRAVLAAALATSRWAGARAQLERRMDTTPEPPAGTTTGAGRTWANVPDSVRIFASCESVMALVSDDRYVYAGLPWGVAVYDFTGAPVTRIALGAAAQTMAATQQQVWVGTPAGLFRLEPATWRISCHPLGNVLTLALDGEKLWLGTRGNVQLLDRLTLDLRAFSSEEMKLSDPRRFTRIVPDGDSVWVDGDSGLLRYDRATDGWSAVENPGPRDPVHLIDLIDGQVWADVYLDDELRHRPARLDRRTLGLAPATLAGAVSRNLRMIAEALVYGGKDEGRLVFRSGWQWYLFDANAGHLRRLSDDYANGARCIGEPTPEGLSLPGGGRVRVGREKEPSGGLYFTAADGTFRRISSPDLRKGVTAGPWADRLSSDTVRAVLFDDERRQAWLCLNDGLTLMRDGEPPLERFGWAEGLNHGPMLDGVALGGRLYFASGWDDSRGGLIAYDPRTRVFTTFFRSDGLDSDKLAGLAVEGGQLLLNYGVEYLRYGDPEDKRRYRHCQPGRFDPTAQRFSSGGEPKFLGQAEGRRQTEAKTAETLPFLGGGMTRRYERGGTVWLCGDLGLVMLPASGAPAPAPAALPVHPLPNESQSLREEAVGVAIPRPILLERLRELAAHSNRYVRANALAAAMQPALDGQEAFAPVIAGCLSDPYLNVRTTAVWLLSRLKGDAALAPLRRALDDTDPYVRAVAALALAKHGQAPALTFFEDILQRDNRFGDLPFGANSSIGVEANALRAYAALAPGADRETFALCMKYPPPMNHDDLKAQLPSFGESLRRHPDAAEVLLAARDENRFGYRRSFAESVFKHAGPALLPVLHHALAANDRVVRSNAARACGAIGDASSIPHLLDALDMESGLSRASIVWALGELKAREALPRLADLYADARNAEHNRRAGAGFLAQQSLAANRASYTELRNLDAIAGDWDDLKVMTTRRPANPRRDEDLLTPEAVLDAVRKIGPSAAQGFYRALAGAAESRDRAEAATGLAEGDDAERAGNLLILRNLLNDTDPPVRAGAAVSLLLLGEAGADVALRERLATGNEADRREILGQLPRLSPSQLEFFRQDLEAIASNDREPIYLRQRVAPLLDKLKPVKKADVR